MCKAAGTRLSGQRRPPTFGGRGLGVCLLPGGRRTPGPPDYIGHWGMGDDMWRGQIEGSVVSRHGECRNRGMEMETGEDFSFVLVKFMSFRSVRTIAGP